MSCNCPNGTVPCPSDTPKDICGKCRHHNCRRHIVLPEKKTLILKSQDEWDSIRNLFDRWTKLGKEHKYLSSAKPMQFPCVLVWNEYFSSRQEPIYSGGIMSHLAGDDFEFEGFATIEESGIQFKFLYEKDLTKTIDEYSELLEIIRLNESEFD